MTFLTIFAWSIFNVDEGGKRFGFLTNAIRAFAVFPAKVRKVFTEVKNLFKSLL